MTVHTWLLVPLAGVFLSVTRPQGADRRVWAVDAAAEVASAIERRDWKQVVDESPPVLAQLPDMARHWHGYALALHYRGRYGEAAEAWKRALELGFQPRETMYNLACAFSRAGEADEALSWLENALDNHFSDDRALREDRDLDAIRDDPRFRELTGWPAPHGLSREERWSYDLDVLVTRMARMHHDLYAKVSRAELEGAVEELRAALAELPDDRIVARLQRLCARIGDGHTMVDLHGALAHVGPRALPSPERDVVYPIMPYWFSDGLFVREAEEAHADLRGAKVLAIGGLAVEEALARLEPYASCDNAMGARFLAPIFLTFPALVEDAGLTDASRVLRLRVALRSDGERVAEIRPGPFPEVRFLEETYLGKGGWDSKGLPLYLERADQPHWFEILPEPRIPGERLAYFQLNAVEDMPDVSLARRCSDLFAALVEQGVDHLVIDMRHNGGGSNLLLPPLIHGLVRSHVDRRGHLFVIIGRRTFSAAMNACTRIERDTEALFVGEPTGSSPNFVGEGDLLRLPCSGVSVYCSSLYWQDSLPWDGRTWIAPHIPAPLASEDYARNRDPALEAIVSYISEHAERTAPVAPTPSGEERDSTGILVVYELRVASGEEERFQRAWQRVTQAAVRAAAGARGSSLTRSPEKPDTFVAIARWQSEEQWRAYRSGPALDAAAVADLNACSSLVSVRVLDEVLDVGRP